MHIIAHRGGILENSLAGFAKSWDAGYRRFECDVHMSLDGVVVVCHDAHYLGKRIAKSRFAEIGDVLKLEDLLKWLRGKREEYHLAIEIKPNCLDVLYLVEKAVFDYSGGGTVAIISMHKDILKNSVLKSKGLIVGKWSWNGVAFCETWGCDSLWIHHSKYSQKLYEDCKNKNIKLYVWTLNCDGIVSDLGN